MVNNKDLIADRPAVKESEDKFQRYNFACRIAETITQTKSNDGIVLGIYGSWGEGKTSIINFIDSELSKNNEIIRIKFNPWRYSDENTLLLNFFDKISKALKIKLLSRKERTGKWLSKKSDFISCDMPKIGDISKIVNTVGNWLGTVDIEELKNRLNEIIIDSKKKLVIFIDDIDRLDKDEIYSVFRLVKLTADFTNTTYILSFDEQVVSKSIADRFGDGDTESGRNFLEKIIQVPLNLPKAQPEALRDYCFELINGIFETIQLDLPKDEGRRFVSLFTTHLLNKFETPRMVVRYSNILSFSIPMLAGEANFVDLMMMEALKIIYPQIYKFVKENPEYFIGDYENALGESDEDKKNVLKEEINKLCNEFHEKEKKSIIELLQELFPLLKKVYQNIYFPYRTPTDWYKNKRIASQEYFNRYFSYSVIKGEISDVSFEQFISNLPLMSEKEIAKEVKELTQNSSAGNFIYKLRNIEDEFNWDITKKLVSVLILNTDLFPNNLQNHFFESKSPKGQLAIFIFLLIKKHNVIKEQLSFSKEIVHKASSLEFAFDILRWLNPNEEKDDNIFTKEQIKEIWKILLKRVLKESGRKDIFEVFPEEAYMICKFWEGFDKENFNQYIHKVIDKNPKKSIAVLRTYLPRYRAIGNEKYRDGNLDEKTYQYLISILDKEYMAQNLLKIYSEEKLSASEVNWEEQNRTNLSDFDAVRQFYHWYKLDKKEELT
ncbi:MAG: KAP family NTPase [Bacteroidales bacterium]|jgi:predicted KAP-like P-loop ATPase|nr:KAP family NTPase [Bacteroidales bacterium]